MGETVPVGYRFHPTEEELVGHYLKHKLLGDDSSSSVHNTIAEVDVCKFEPWELPAFSKIKSEDPQWFFFCPRELKYKKSSNRYNRTTKTGYWKPTGRDRNIKTRGTDHVIGTKKTLVFHKGHPPRAVRTNWVIHEYHAATVPPDMRTHVLCHLKEKAEKKAEGRTDVLVNDGEPVAADHGNEAPVDRSPDVYTLPAMNVESVFPQPPQADESDFTSIQFSPIFIEQEQYSQDSLFTNACFGIENNMPFPFDDTTEEEVDADLFLASILDDDVFISEERRHSFVNESTPSLSMRMVHYESSETEAELVSAQFGNILEATSVCNERVVSNGCRVMKMVKTPQDATYTGPPSFSAETEVNREKRDSSASGDNFWGVDTSDDSIANEPSLSTFVMEASSSSPPVAIPSTSRRVKTKYHPRSNNSVSQGAASRRSQTQRKLSSKAVSQHEVPKETRMPESSKDQKKAQDARSRQNLETTSKYQSSSVNKKGCFMYQETPSTTQNSNPRSVYLVNVVVGFSLLVVTICDLVSFGKCG